jgi:putative lipoic acid-binding regulatory protein
MVEKNTYKPFCQKKPDIAYPCLWEYTVIGEEQQTLTEIIIAACAPVVPDITLSNVSSSGTYYSLKATLTVEDEKMRLTIFESIQKHPAVKMVI